jgi:hypothetical protein
VSAAAATQGNCCMSWSAAAAQLNATCVAVRTIDIKIMEIIEAVVVNRRRRSVDPDDIFAVTRSY